MLAGLTERLFKVTEKHYKLNWYINTATVLNPFRSPSQLAKKDLKQLSYLEFPCSTSIGQLGVSVLDILSSLVRMCWMLDWILNEVCRSSSPYIFYVSSTYFLIFSYEEQEKITASSPDSRKVADSNPRLHYTKGVENGTPCFLLDAQLEEDTLRTGVPASG